MNIIPVPGLKTVSERDYAHCAQRRRAGYEWVSFQVQNDTSVRSYDLAPAKSAGLDAGCWGVSYDAANFHRDGKALAEQTLKVGGQHLIGDIEMAAKNTRATRGLRPYIDGVRAGGWTGPVHLNTMGPPANPEVNDYQIDLESFLETGGGILTQAYANETDLFTPELAVAYWTRVGVPKDRLNLTISLMPAEADKQYPGRRYDGATYLQLLKDAGWTHRAISIFLDEGMTDEDETELKPITAPLPPPATSPIAENRQVALDHLADSVAYWRNDADLTEQAVARQRQTIAWRVLNVKQTTFNVDTLNQILDQMGAPKP